MLNFHNMVKAPAYQWRVEIKRCTTANAVQNARQNVVYVTAPNEQDAMREAKRQLPSHHPISVRKV